MSYSEQIYRAYGNIFNAVDDIEEETEEDKEIKQKEQESSWMGFIYSFAKGDVLKFNDITKMNFIFLLNVRSYELSNKNIKQYYDRAN